MVKGWFGIGDFDVLLLEWIELSTTLISQFEGTRANVVLYLLQFSFFWVPYVRKDIPSGIDTNGKPENEIQLEEDHGKQIRT